MKARYEYFSPYGDHGEDDESDDDDAERDAHDAERRGRADHVRYAPDEVIVDGVGEELAVEERQQDAQHLDHVRVLVDRVLARVRLDRDAFRRRRTSARCRLATATASCVRHLFFSVFFF